MILRAAPFQGPPSHGGTPSHQKTTPLIRIPPLIRMGSRGHGNGVGPTCLGKSLMSWLVNLPPP